MNCHQCHPIKIIKYFKLLKCISTLYIAIGNNLRLYILYNITNNSVYLINILFFIHIYKTIFFIFDIINLYWIIAIIYKLIITAHFNQLSHYKKHWSKQ